MERNCPNCDRHCPVDDLHCGRGREYFGLSETAEGRNEHRGHVRGHDHSQRASDEPRVIQLLRRCGHALHHGGLGNAQRMLGALSSSEVSTLERLLEQCLAGLGERRGRH